MLEFLKWQIDYYLRSEIALSIWRNLRENVSTSWKREWVKNPDDDRKIFREIDLQYCTLKVNGLRLDESFKQVRRQIAQCGNCGNLFSHLFGKKFVKVTVLLKQLLSSRFDEIFSQWEQIFHFSTLCAPSAQCGKTRNLVSPKNISSTRYYTSFFSKNVSFTKCLQKMCETKLQQFPHCAVWTLRKFTYFHTFLAIKYFVKVTVFREITKWLLWRIFFSVSVNLYLCMYCTYCKYIVNLFHDFFFFVFFSMCKRFHEKLPV